MIQDVLHKFYEHAIQNLCGPLDPFGPINPGDPIAPFIP